MSKSIVISDSPFIVYSDAPINTPKDFPFKNTRFFQVLYFHGPEFRSKVQYRSNESFI